MGIEERKKKEDKTQQRLGVLRTNSTSLPVVGLKSCLFVGF